MTGRREERQLAAGTALGVAESEKLIWTIGGFTDLNIALQRQEARLAFAGVPDDLTKALHRVTLACWRDYQDPKGYDEQGEEERGITTSLLDARLALSRAVAAYLLRKKLRSRKQRAEALDVANAELAEFAEKYPNFRFR
jgi:hypothetical protein